MAGATTPDDIWFLNGSDPAPGPHTLTGLMAGSVQAAFSKRQIHTFKWETLAEKDAQTGMTYGDIGYCEQNNVVYVYSAVTGNWDGLSNTDLLPDPITVIGGAGTTITSAAATFAPLSGIPTISFGSLTRDLLVTLRYSAILATTTTGSYARIGVAVSGGVSIDATTDSFGSTSAGLSPFSANVESTPAFGAKDVILPAGAASTMTFQAMRFAASGTQVASYSVMQAIPVRWVV